MVLKQENSRETMGSSIDPSKAKNCAHRRLLVSVCQGCCTEPHSSRGSEAKTNVPAELIFGEGSLPVLQTVVCPHWALPLCEREISAFLLLLRRSPVLSD